MRITTKTDYAVILLTELGRHSNRPVSLQYVADSFSISEAYLQRIAARLKKARLIKAKHGAFGGYNLTKKPEEITLREVVETVGDNLVSVPCANKDHVCPHQDTCPAHEGWFSFQHQLDQLFEDATISSLIKK